MKRKLQNLFGGHVNIGKRITVYGRNAMHWSVRIATLKWGYICFRLPLPCFGRWWQLYYYCSPNATPWAATFMLGKKAHREDWIRYRERREYLGHNFDTEDEYNHRTLYRINDIDVSEVYGVHDGTE